LIRFTAEGDDAGARPDRALRARYPKVDRQLALKLLKEGRVRVSGAKARLATRLAAGDEVEIDVDARRVGAPRVGGVEVRWQGEGVCVLDKPAGLPMHEGTGVGADDPTLRRWASDHLEIEEDFQPSFLGRLDRPTSGLVLCATSRGGLATVEPAWSGGAIEKAYLTVVHGRTRSHGTIDVPLAARRARHKGTGRKEEALTRYKALKRGRLYSVLLVVIETGRTHQIRRHMKAIRHPVVGDKRYGDRRREADLEIALELEEGALEGQLMLHCHRFSHGQAGVPLPEVIESPMPERMTALYSQM
jgi:23S rRNA pseudouridine955/2504/2580 synthase